MKWLKYLTAGLLTAGLAISSSALADAAITLADNGITINGTGAVAENSRLIINAGGTYEVTGTLSNGQIMVSAPDEDKVELILNGVNITSSENAAIYGMTGDKLTVHLAAGSENILNDASRYTYVDREKEEPDAALFSKMDLTLKGDGTLTIHGNFASAVNTKDDLVIKGGTYIVDAMKHGFRGKDSLTVENGNFTITARSDGMNTNGDLTVEDGVIDINAQDDGIHADANLYIKGGSINIPTCYEGFEGTTITISGGDTFINAQNDAFSAAYKLGENTFGYGANPDVWIRLTGGSVEAVSGGDTMDANGYIYVDGGRIRLSAPVRPNYEGAFLCNGDVTFTGGDVAVVGNIGVGVYNLGDQPLLLVSHPQDQAAGTVVSIRDQDGNVVVSVDAQTDFFQSGFTSPDLKLGETYGVYLGDEHRIDVTLNDLITRIGDDGGDFTGGYRRRGW